MPDESSLYVGSEPLKGIAALFLVEGCLLGGHPNWNKSEAVRLTKKDSLALNVEIDPAGFGKAMVTICEMVCDVFRQEPRLLELTSPVFVLGDLHGNFPDLINFEKTLWGLGPTLTPSCFLFLGDYVDRGAHSVEVIAYLFAYKVQNPKRIWLLRGNHEIREVQLRYTFLKEATTKFGETLGKQVWQSVNLAFDALPLAAVIDDRDSTLN
ncbi:serine/threonine-protein phosphatase SIT4-like [Schistocerca americana]|uniref:serine/threonine-protein phosphatase SIT4-like n=1 Tax=Schistocerca americana TaxID=7009 RepID=UPI001F4FCA45|nr:serine/threonine-protein phosphatase SIT4-like [Schistocerca americana]